jgi:hypothetical protein
MKKIFFFALTAFLIASACQQKELVRQKEIISPEEPAKPWVYWYWMHGCITREAITADLEAMKDAGLGGAYIFTIKDVTNPPLFDPSFRQLTPGWWQMETGYARLRRFYCCRWSVDHTGNVDAKSGLG